MLKPHPPAAPGYPRARRVLRTATDRLDRFSRKLTRAGEAAPRRSGPRAPRGGRQGSQVPRELPPRTQARSSALQLVRSTRRAGRACCGRVAPIHSDAMGLRGAFDENAPKLIGYRLLAIGDWLFDLASADRVWPGGKKPPYHLLQCLDPQWMFVQARNQCELSPAGSQKAFPTAQPNLLKRLQAI